MQTIAAEPSAASWRRGEYEVSADPGRLDIGLVHGWIANDSYWAAGIPRATFERATRHSLAFGIYRGPALVGFARVVTDRATFAYLCDVWVVAAERGHGLGRWLVECILAHPDLQGLRRFSLMTRDAQGLYARYGFRALPDPGRYMELHNAEAYR
jgi:ribosomal protein S18 acetylase RimI-like enzyme